MQIDDFVANYRQEDVEELWLIVSAAVYYYRDRNAVFEINDRQRKAVIAFMEQTGWGRDEDMDHCALRWCQVIAEYPTKPLSLWNDIKREMHLLCCTKDKKYDRLRRKLGSISGKSQFAVTSAFASVMSVHVGVASATIMTPLCAILLLAVLGLGHVIVCQRLSVPDKFDPYEIQGGVLYTEPGETDGKLGLTLQEAKEIRLQKNTGRPRHSPVRRGAAQKS